MVKLSDVKKQTQFNDERIVELSSKQLLVVSQTEQ